MADIPTAAYTGDGFDYVGLRKIVNDLTVAAENQLKILSARSSIKVSDMFEMQMRMNNLTQFSELASSVLSGLNSTFMTMARAAKGG